MTLGFKYKEGSVVVIKHNLYIWRCLMIKVNKKACGYITINLFGIIEKFC